MKISTLSIPVILFVLSGCDTLVHEVGNGRMITEEIEIGEFEEIVVGGNFEIFLEQGTKPGLTITADENLHQYIDVDVRGDRLEIETSERVRSNEGLKLYITYTQLSAIDVGGATELANEGIIKGDYLSINMSGAGAVDLNVNLRLLKVSLSGAGAVELKGSANEQNIKMSGAGDYDARDLISQHCIISISGVGSADVNVTESLDAEVSGVGGIAYSGNPKDVKTDVSGLGSIERAE